MTMNEESLHLASVFAGNRRRGNSYLPHRGADLGRLTAAAGHPRHAIRIGQSAIAEGIGLVGALDDEAEFLVQREGGRVVCIYRQLEAGEAEPALAGIDQRGQQGGTDAAAHVVVVHAQADSAGMRAAAGEATEIGSAEDDVAAAGDDGRGVGRAALHPGAHLFRVWNGTRSVLRRKPGRLSRVAICSASPGRVPRISNGAGSVSSGMVALLEWRGGEGGNKKGPNRSPVGPENASAAWVSARAPPPRGSGT